MRMQGDEDAVVSFISTSHFHFHMKYHHSPNTAPFLSIDPRVLTFDLPTVSIQSNYTYTCMYVHLCTYVSNLKCDYWEGCPM